MVKLSRISKINTTNKMPNIESCPNWYTSAIRARAMDLCRNGEMPRNALITAGCNKSEVDKLIAEQDDPTTISILDELYGELNKCLTELKCMTYKIATLKTSEDYNATTIKVLENCLTRINDELKDDPYWNKYNNQPINLQYEILAM